MKIKASELTGPALDWAVAKSLENEGHDSAERFVRDHRIGFTTRYSETWSQGGPIKEREGIATRRHSGGNWYAMLSRDLGDGERAQWSEFSWAGLSAGSKRVRRVRFSADSELQAAMRCFVASRLGDEVDIPDEVLSWV